MESPKGTPAICRPSTVTLSLFRTRMPARAGRLKVVLLAGKLLVIAGGKVDAEGRREFLEGRGQLVEIGPGSVEQVAGDEDDVGLQRWRPSPPCAG